MSSTLPDDGIGRDQRSARGHLDGDAYLSLVTLREELEAELRSGSHHDRHEHHDARQR